MPASALIKFTQGATINIGAALKGAIGSLLTVNNNNNTSVASWQIDLLEVPTSSSVTPATPFAQWNGSGSFQAPAASITPDVVGSYRWRLTVWSVANFVGPADDMDIRVFSVPLTNGLVLPPPQIWPLPLPPVASGLPYAKNNEMNFAGQTAGWSGTGADGLLSNTIRRVDAIQSPGIIAGVYNVSASDPTMFPSVQAAVTAMGPGPFPTNSVLIRVWPGSYVHTSLVTIPSGVTLQGAGTQATTFQNDSTNLFQASTDTNFYDFSVNGSPTTGLYVVDCNNSVGVQIKNVNLYNNGGAGRQNFVKQVGSTWHILNIVDCLVDRPALSGYAVLLQNTSGTARFCDTWIDHCFWDNFFLTSTGGSLQVQGCQDIRVHFCTIRQNNFSNISMELGGVSGQPWIDIRHTYLLSGDVAPGAAASGTPINSQSGTYVTLINSDAKGSIFGGSSTLRNSAV